MKRREQKELTKSHLLRVAYTKFAERGFLATKTLDIAESAGVSHGTIFLHFPTKEELLIKTIDEFGLNVGARLKELAEKKGSVKEILSAHLETIEEYEDFYARIVTEGPLLPVDVRSRVFLIQSGIAHYLEKALIKGPPLYFLVNSWLGLIHYYLANRDLFAPDKSVIACFGKDLLNHFVQTFQLGEN